MGPERDSPEIACQSQLGGITTSGGGFSLLVNRPDYQIDAVNNFINSNSDIQPGYNIAGRGFPDVVSRPPSQPLFLFNASHFTSSSTF